MMFRKLLKVAANVALSAVTLVFSLITIFIAVPIGLFESLRRNCARGEGIQYRNGTSKWKLLSFWHTFNAPIYVPEHEREIIQLLISGNIAQLVALLERRVSLGSRWASGLLGYLEAAGVLSGKPDLAAAISRCTESARAGDAYAQFVLGWALWETRERAKGMRWMKRSGIDGKFLPAWASLGMMLYKLSGKGENTRRIALKALWNAHRRGHIAPLGMLCSAAYQGHFGRACRLLGFVAYPFVVLRTSLMGWWNPLSERSFVWYPPQIHRLVPVLKSSKPAVAPPSSDQRMAEPAIAPQLVSPEDSPEVKGPVAGNPNDPETLQGSGVT